MAAGITVPYDTLGLQTADLITNQWPLRSGLWEVMGSEPRPKEFTITSTQYGVHVPCHAGQSFQAPCLPAGMSKRMGAFYEKTGVSQHRTEPGFRDKTFSYSSPRKGMGTLTELKIPDYGTLRRSTRLPGRDLDALEPTLPRSALSSQRSQMLEPQLQAIAREDDMVSNAGSRRSTHSKASRASRASRASGASGASGGRGSNASRRTRAQQEAEPWNFEALPFYDRTNASYGRTAAGQGSSNPIIHIVFLNIVETTHYPWFQFAFEVICNLEANRNRQPKDCWVLHAHAAIGFTERRRFAYTIHFCDSFFFLQILTM
eukprot:Skav208391  [mRNA]  locus=scaffold1179:20990:24283:- [translate_table: standard]